MNKNIKKAALIAVILVSGFNGHVIAEKDGQGQPQNPSRFQRVWQAARHRVQNSSARAVNAVCAMNDARRAMIQEARQNHPGVASAVDTTCEVTGAAAVAFGSTCAMNILAQNQLSDDQITAMLFAVGGGYETLKHKDAVVAGAGAATGAVVDMAVVSFNTVANTVGGWLNRGAAQDAQQNQGLPQGRGSMLVAGLRQPQANVVTNVEDFLGIPGDQPAPDAPQGRGSMLVAGLHQRPVNVVTDVNDFLGIRGGDQDQEAQPVAELVAGQEAADAKVREDNEMIEWLNERIKFLEAELSQIYAQGQAHRAELGVQRARNQDQDAAFAYVIEQSARASSDQKEGFNFEIDRLRAQIRLLEETLEAERPSLPAARCSGLAAVPQVDAQESQDDMMELRNGKKICRTGALLDAATEALL